MAVRKTTRKKAAVGRKKSTRKKAVATNKKSTTARKNVTGARKKTTARKKTAAAKKTAVRKKSTRKYSKAAGNSVGKEMDRYKKGTARSGRGGAGGKVKSRKQAIAIALSEARAAGKNVPPNPNR